MKAPRPRETLTSEPTGRRPVGGMDAAIERVRADRTSWEQAALSVAEVEERLETLGRAIRDGDLDRVPVTGSPGERALDRRLLDLLRRELLKDDRLSTDRMVELLRRMEELRVRLEPAWHQTLAAGLSGENALDFVVEVAHDLRSPLTSIMFLADTLRKAHSGDVNDVQRQQLAIIYGAALSLVGMTNDLMDLAREESVLTTDSLESGPFSVLELVDRVRDTVAPMAEEKRLDLLFLTPSHDIRIGDGMAIRRVLLNLTTNALKFTDSGHVEIVVTERGPNLLEFSVRDTGRGMDEKTVEALFQPFRRNRSRTGFDFSSTGLGLAMCRRLVELMGGELLVETRPGGGSRFSFELTLPRGSRV